MTKRKKSDRDNDFEHLTRKLRKLERKIQTARRRRHDSSSSDGDNEPLCNLTESEMNATTEDIHVVTDQEDQLDKDLPGCSYWDTYPRSTVSKVTSQGDDAVSPRTDQPQPSSSIRQKSLPPLALLPPVTNNTTDAAQVDSNAVATNSQPHTDADANPELDPNLLEILGDDPSVVKEYGEEIQKDLAIRLNHFIRSGLNKDQQKELKAKYLVPANCKMMKAPALNLEIRASLVEAQVKRDKGIESKQVFTSCALSSLSSAITLLLAESDKNREVLKILMDTARILGHIQHSDSILRRFFILSTVKKELKDQLEKTNIEETLFGDNLVETIKSAKTISKSAADIRAVVTKNNNQRQRGSVTNNRSLNSRAPPKSRRPAATTTAGGARYPRQVTGQIAQTTRATTTSTQNNNYRTSSRQHPQRYRR